MNLPRPCGSHCEGKGNAAEVTPVGQVGECKFTVGPVTKQLREDYLKEVRLPATSAAAE
jgi:branched-subunit amino acid aminotransferase/4-amino-4-deoxychorismate lyase